MLTKCRAIVIKTIDYSETSVILKCYTSSNGMQSYLVNGVRKNKGSIRPSQLQPLTLLELDAYHQQNKGLQRIKELKCDPPLRSLHFDMTKSAIGIFTGEVIYRSIREENQSDPALFDFLYHSIQVLDIEQERLANFPIYFLLQLSRFLGFYPRYEASEAIRVGFNFKDGEFEPYDEQNLFQADPVLSDLLVRFLTGSYEDQKLLKISSLHRKQLINLMIMYYNQHMNGFSNMKSHEILAEVLE